MKKIICYLSVIAILVLCFGACGSDNSSVSSDISFDSQSNTNISTTSASSSISSENSKFWRLNEFVYSYPSYMNSEERSNGLKIYNEEYSIVIFGGIKNLGKFNSWDTIVDDSKDDLFLLMFDAYRPFITPQEQSVTNSEKMSNKNGIELLKVEGIVKGYDDDDKDVQAGYIAYYHLSPSGKIRCLFTLIKDDKYFTSTANRTEADRILRDMAENLKLAE